MGIDKIKCKRSHIIPIGFHQLSSAAHIFNLPQYFCSGDKIVDTSPKESGKIKRNKI